MPANLTAARRQSPAQPPAFLYRLYTKDGGKPLSLPRKKPEPFRNPGSAGGMKASLGLV